MLGSDLDPIDPAKDTPRARAERNARLNAAGWGIFFIPVFGFILLFVIYPGFVAVVAGTILIMSEVVDAWRPSMVNDNTDFAIILSPAVILGFIAIRLEQRLGARSGVYRFLRHLVRVVMLGAVVNWGARTEMGLPEAFDPLTLVADVLSRPKLALITIIPMLLYHLILIKWQQVREFWHGVLRFFYLRSTSLGESYGSRNMFGFEKVAE
ncbi:hypothetical protein [Humisphaera borealis]|uniref:Uncharacterized protein n=1 Tax=Humisphaera borealis TaxID=2807512 RepID=A0A7M2WVQ6_9BACT|nr:hypothetical protein [Humisphaera borealis]QOV88560.1 hypothetical protein IPV69_20285 [Humisphaera borealis]